MLRFIVSPSEAVLIGLFLEEYLQARCDSDKFSIFDFIKSHLRSFVPDMAVCRKVEVAEDELPSDIECTEDPACMISRATRRVFLKQESRFFEFKGTDRSRKSLVDLLDDLVWPYAAKSLLEEVVLLPEDSPEREARVSEMRTLLAHPEGMWRIRERNGVDDATRIEHVIRSLIQQNDVDDLFRVGRLLGGVLADCHRLAKWLVSDYVVPYDETEENWWWCTLSAGEFVTRYKEHLTQLHAPAPIKRLSYAPLIIERELAAVPDPGAYLWDWASAQVTYSTLAKYCLTL
jgi:hypothetical protein